jgi:hypothetical protein
VGTGISYSTPTSRSSGAWLLLLAIVLGFALVWIIQ